MKTEILKDIEGVFLAERVAGSGIFSDLHSDIKYLLSLRNKRKPEPSEYEVSGEWRSWSSSSFSQPSRPGNSCLLIRGRGCRNRGCPPG